MKLSTYFFLALLYLFCGNAFGQASVKKPGIDPQKLAAINDLLEITGAVNLSQQVLVKIIEEQKDAHPEIPSQIWDRYEAKLDLKDLLDFMIEIYDRHFSTEDLVAVAGILSVSARSKSYQRDAGCYDRSEGGWPRMGP